MKYKWTSSPPVPGIPGVSAEKSNVWPKPIKETLKYSLVPLRKNENVVFAIGKLKSGRWEVYLWEWQNMGEGQWRRRWFPQSKMTKTGPAYHLGYSIYQNAYRSIPKHLKDLRK